MKSKSYYRQFEAHGYKYAGSWDSLHHYVLEDRGVDFELLGYRHVAANDSDVAEGNIETMLRLGLTRLVGARDLLVSNVAERGNEGA